MQENKNENQGAFQELKVFEQEEMNILCDNLYKEVKKITNENMRVVGSLAKIFSGDLSEDYAIKDVDFVVSKEALEGIKQGISAIENVMMIAHYPNRLIFHTRFFLCVEIWAKDDFFKDSKPTYYFKDKIPFYGTFLKDKIWQ